MNYKTIYSSPLGKLFITSNGKAITGLYLENQKGIEKNLSKGKTKDNLDIFYTTKKWLDEYFLKRNPPQINVDLAFNSTTFQINVWKILCNIPYGQITTYGKISNEINNKINNNLSRAVGKAISSNPILIIIPCHRVIGSDNSIKGFAAGVNNKIKLLKLEGLDVSKIKI